MRFAHKLTLLIILILAVALALSGYFTVRQNFESSLERAVSQNTTIHLFERHSVANMLKDSAQKGEKDTEASLQEFVKAQADYVGAQGSAQTAYSVNGKILFSTIPTGLSGSVSDIIKAGAGQGYMLAQEGAYRYMLFVSAVESPYLSLSLISAYDITDIYVERDRQVQSALYTNIVILLAASVAVIIASIRLTMPIAALSRISRKMSEGAYGVRTDICTEDEIGELGESFNTMAKAVEEHVGKLNLSLRQREDFMAAFTHEMKTPMTAIIGYADLIRFKETNPEIRQKASQFIYREASRLEVLSQKLLLLMGLSKEKMVFGPVALDTLFRTAGRATAPALREKEITLQYKAAGGMEAVGDSDLIVDLLCNLILNAANAKPKDAAVYLFWRQEAAGVRIIVKDRGCGIAADQLGRVTEPFYMADKSRARQGGGSGIGLALCKRICELHGSKLTIESILGEGTEISFVLKSASK